MNSSGLNDAAASVLAAIKKYRWLSAASSDLTMSTATAPNATCLYHSFPRRLPAESDEARSRRSLTILDSIIRNGLLLTIEDVSWREDMGGTMNAPVGAVQRRICFTNLHPTELREHADFFGPISIEYTPEWFVHLGGVPVIYFPHTEDACAGLEGLGAAFVARLADVHALLGILAQLEEKTARGGDLSMSGTSPTGAEIGRTQFTQTETAAIHRFFGCVHQYATIPSFDQLRSAVATAGGLFYPTDDVNYTGTLGYYRQREWRILDVHKNGQAITTRATSEQQKELLSMNEAFFRKRFRFNDGEDEMAARCHFFRMLNGRHVLSYARRILVPPELADAARAALAKENLQIEVATA